MEETTYILIKKISLKIYPGKSKENLRKIDMGKKLCRQDNPDTHAGTLGKFQVLIPIINDGPK